MSRSARRTTASTTSSEPAHDPASRRRIERILLLKSWSESLVLEAHLGQLGLPFVVRPFGDPGFGSFWRREEGWGVLYAPAHARQRIAELYRDLFGHEAE